MWTSRILHDGADREAWERRRHAVIGASDVKAYANPTAVAGYLRAKIASRDFTGNAYTARGHEWEPQLIAAAGVPTSTALIHAPDEEGFAATPDGIAFDGSLLAEAKLRHGLVASGPSTGEWRQLAWQLMCVPEAQGVRFVEGELLASPLGWSLRREPQITDISRDDRRIRYALGVVLPIAREVLTLVRLHHDLERTLT